MKQIVIKGLEIKTFAACETADGIVYSQCLVNSSKNIKTYWSLLRHGSKVLDSKFKRLSVAFKDDFIDRDESLTTYTHGFM